MRLVSYNILDGGEGRADPLAEVIESQRPDIVVLVEADNPVVVERIAGRLNMDVAAGAGKRHGAAILSRWAIVESVNHALLLPEMTDCFLEARIADPSGQAWTIGAIHLHAHATEADELRREKEVDAILKAFAARRNSNQPHLLAGDFNANSPAQQIDPKTVKPRTKQEMESNGGAIPRRAVQKLLSAGYVDTLPALRGEGAQKMCSFTTQYPGQRVDYIFSFGIDRKRFTDACIEQDRLAKYASDHFPVMVEIA
jgi:endonuclease/exonuclease/phosphatase family metal-dependent hydrolase